MKTNASPILSQRSFRLLLTFLTVCLVLAGCGKKDDPAPTTPLGFLTTGTWKVTSFTSSDALIQALGALIVNSEYVFKTDGNFTYTVLGIQGGTGKWEFANSDTRIIFNKGTQEETDNEIVTLNNGSMELKEVVGSVTSTTKYTKK